MSSEGSQNTSNGSQFSSTSDGAEEMEEATPVQVQQEQRERQLRERSLSMHGSHSSDSDLRGTALLKKMDPEIYELLRMRHDSLMFAKFGITDENELRIKCNEASNRLNKSKPDEIVADALSWCDMLFAAKQDWEAKARQTRSNDASKSDRREDGIDGSLWKREPWFSRARKASWNDDCGRPAVSESFGIPNRIWIPPAPIFAVFGDFCISWSFLSLARS